MTAELLAGSCRSVRSFASVHDAPDPLAEFSLLFSRVSVSSMLPCPFLVLLASTSNIGLPR